MSPIAPTISTVSNPHTIVAANAMLSKVVTTTISAGTNISKALDFTSLDLYGYTPLIVVLPSAWTSSYLQIAISIDNVTFNPLHSWLTSSPYRTSAAVNANDAIVLDNYVARGGLYLQFWSVNNSGAAINQVALRTLQVICGTN